MSRNHDLLDKFQTKKKKKNPFHCYLLFRLFHVPLLCCYPCNTCNHFGFETFNFIKTEFQKDDDDDEVEKLIKLTQ